MKKKKKSIVIWLMGIPCSGKTTLATAMEDILNKKGISCVALDGDEVRETINSDLGFTDKDRLENIRRSAQIAKLLSRNNILTICSFITPSKETQELARNIIGDESFFEIYVKCSLQTCVKRDVKGLYGKALRGEISNLTGYNAEFNPPQNPFMEIDTENISVDDAVSAIISAISPVLFEAIALKV